MRILAAGAYNQHYRDICLEYNCGKLFSALTERKHILEWPSDRFLMVDSGAYSWNIQTLGQGSAYQTRKKLPDVKEYCADYVKFYEENKDSNFVFVELDTYGVLDYDYLTGVYNEVKQMNGKAQFMRCYHLILDDGDLSVLKKWIDEGQDYIGLALDSEPYLQKIFDLTREKIRFHGFAMTKDSWIIKYPFYSCDSTTVLSAVKFGSILRYRLWQLGKDKMIKDKILFSAYSDADRISRGVQSMKESEIFYTKLWKQRGVLWND